MLLVDPPLANLTDLTVLEKRRDQASYELLFLKDKVTLRQEEIMKGLKFLNSALESIQEK